MPTLLDLSQNQMGRRTKCPTLDNEIDSECLYALLASRDGLMSAGYKPKEKFMQLAIAEAKRARDHGDYAIGLSSRGSLRVGKWSSRPPAIA